MSPKAHPSHDLRPAYREGPSRRHAPPDTVRPLGSLRSRANVGEGVCAGGKGGGFDTFLTKDGELSRPSQPRRRGPYSCDNYPGGLTSLGSCHPPTHFCAQERMCTHPVKVPRRRGPVALRRRTSIPCQSAHPTPLALYHPNSFVGFGKPLSSRNVIGKVLGSVSFQMGVLLS